VLPMPDGVFYWDGGPEGALLLTEFIAKLLHPDRFADLDMRAERLTRNDPGMAY